MGNRPRLRMKARMRSNDSNLNFYVPFVNGEWIQARIVSRVVGESEVLCGNWKRLFDEEQRLIGYTHADGVESEVTRESCRSLSAGEMTLYAGRAFRCGRSHTAGMSEEQRQARRSCRNGLRLPPEDAVERVEAKVQYFGEHRIVK